MGLFDDLLKKPTSTPATDTSTPASGGNPPATGGAGNPPANDPLNDNIPPPTPVIQKTEEVSIMTESAEDTAPSEPAPVTAVAVDDISSILISSDTTDTPSLIITDEADTLMSSTIMTPSESLLGISNVEVAEVAPTIVKSAEVTDFGNLFGDADESTTDAMSIPPSPIADTAITTEADTQIAKAERILGLTEEVESMPIVEEVAIEEETPVESILVEEEKDIETAKVITEDTPIEELIAEDRSSLLGFAVEEAPIAVALETVYEHPSEFIAASIARIDAMIARIDAAHGSKLSEALGYKTEKEKYTTLEEQAYADAEKYVTEKDHALAMRAYFVEQGAYESHKEKSITASESPRTAEEATTETVIAEKVQPTETTGSVETALTGIAVQSAVTEMVTPTKKAKKETVEEVGLLGL